MRKWDRNINILPNLLTYTMKTINVTFEDKEYEGLLKQKRETSWHDFIIGLKKEGDTNGDNKSE